MWASGLATVLPREARGTASKPFGDGAHKLEVDRAIEAPGLEDLFEQGAVIQGPLLVSRCRKAIDRNRDLAHRGESAEVTDRE